MKKPLAILLLLFNFVSSQETIAVVEFEGKGISQVEASALTDELEIHITNFGGYTVVERGRMEEILKEQGLQQTGCISSECAVEIGKLLGTKFIILGSISKVGRTFSVNAKIVDVQTGQIVIPASYKFRGEIDDLLISGMAEVASQLIGKDVSSDIVNAPTSRITAPAYGSATFTSSVDSVNIYLYDPESVEPIEFLGVTPFTIEQQNPGIYTFVATKDDYENFIDNYEVTAGLNSTVSVSLESIYGIVSFISNQDDVSIYSYDNVNNDVSDLLGSASIESPLILEEQLRGVNYFVAKKFGYQDFQTSYVVRSGKIDTVDIDLISIYGSLSVNHGDRLAVVEKPISLQIDGIDVGTTPFYSDSLLFGSHELLARAEGFRDFSETFLIEGGSTRTINFEFEQKSGLISVNLTRRNQWGEITQMVFVDGNEFRNPSTPAKISQGTHTLLIKEYGYQDYIEEFFINDGESVLFESKAKRITVPVNLTLSPTYASVSIRGRSLGAVRSGIPNLSQVDLQLEFGEYDYTATASKHFPLTSEFSIDSNTPFNLEISLNPKSRSKTALYSLFVPGSGQFYAENTLRGLIFFTATVASGYLLYSSNETYLDENSLLTQYERDYTSAVGLNDIDKTRSLYLSQVDQVNQLQIQLLNYGIALGTTWLLNLIDAVFFNGIPSK